MRGWKAVSFEQFSVQCIDRSPITNAGWHCDNPRTMFTRCSQCTCPVWRNFGRADIKVVKIKSHNSESKPCRVCGSKFTKQVTVDECESCGALK